jgi:hypothetical protein
MIAELFKKFYEKSDVSLKQVQKEHEFLRTYLQKMTLQIPDPGLIRFDCRRNDGCF